jgi:death-on-curing protein
VSSRDEPRWLKIETILILHDRGLALHGGPEGVRDLGLLESALARPINRYAYEGLVDIVELSATYASAVSSNHPFVDGNKRAAFLAMGAFLDLNGKRLIAPQAESVLTIFKLAAGGLTIDELASWVRDNLAD